MESLRSGFAEGVPELETLILRRSRRGVEGEGPPDPPQGVHRRGMIPPQEGAPKKVPPFSLYTVFFVAHSSPGLGKLKKARRNNYASSPIDQQETNFWIEEEYFYNGLDGRVSRRDSVCHPYSLTQSFTYHDLGGVEELGYPECEVACVP